MTIKQLGVVYPGATPETWHQHHNGGGWVANSATVPATLHLPENAIVGARAKIGEGAEIGAWAKIGAWATVGERAEIGAWAKIGEGAEFVISPLHIIGSRNLVCVASATDIAIGCIVHDFPWWKENYRRVGRENDYTPVQITEYWMYIRLCHRWQLTYMKHQLPKNEAS